MHVKFHRRNEKNRGFHPIPKTPFQWMNPKVIGSYTFKSILGPTRNDSWAKRAAIWKLLSYIYFFNRLVCVSPNPFEQNNHSFKDTIRWLKEINSIDQCLENKTTVQIVTKLHPNLISMLTALGRFICVNVWLLALSRATSHIRRFVANPTVIKYCQHISFNFMTLVLLFLCSSKGSWRLMSKKKKKLCYFLHTIQSMKKMEGCSDVISNRS